MLRRKSKQATSETTLTMTVERGGPPDADDLPEAMRILATWLLRRHQAMLRAPKQRDGNTPESPSLGGPSMD